LITAALAGAVQTASIVSVMPFIVLLTNPELLQSNELLIRAYEVLRCESYNEFLTIFGLFAIAILTFGNVFVAFEQWLSLRFMATLGHRMKSHALQTILQKPSEYVTTHHSAKLSDVILSQVERAVDGVIGTFVSIFSSMALAALIVLALLIISLQTTLLTLLGLLIAYVAVFLFMRRGISDDGQEFTRLSAAQLTAVKDALDGVKEIQTRRAEGFFGRRFAASSLRLSKLTVHFGVMNFLPYYLLETVVFAGFVVVALYLLYTTSDAGISLSYLALYGMAVYRLVPAMRGVFEGIAELQHDADSVPTVLEHLTERADSPIKEPMPEPRIEIRMRQASFSYASSDRRQLQGVSLSIPIGSSVCLFGPSGSGKTTILNLIAGLLYPAQGAVECDGTAIGPATIDGWRQQLGYSPQQVFLFADTLASNIAFGVEAGDIDQQRVEAVASLVNLHEYAMTRLPDGYQTIVAEHGATLSGGQRQRVGIARALYHDPNILLFDESFAGLDAENRTAILDRLFAMPGKTLIFSSHEPLVAARCDKVLVIDHGELIAEGPYENLLQSSPRFLEILSRTATVAHS
jgi:ABC-type multidrug transport system fused ATPase/permease subunit